MGSCNLPSELGVAKPGDNPKDFRAELNDSSKLFLADFLTDAEPRGGSTEHSSEM